MGTKQDISAHARTLILALVPEQQTGTGFRVHSGDEPLAGGSPPFDRAFQVSWIGNPSGRGVIGDGTTSEWQQVMRVEVGYHARGDWYSLLSQIEDDEEAIRAEFIRFNNGFNTQISGFCNILPDVDYEIVGGPGANYGYLRQDFQVVYEIVRPAAAFVAEERVNVEDLNEVALTATPATSVFAIDLTGVAVENDLVLIRWLAQNTASTVRALTLYHDAGTTVAQDVNRLASTAGNKIEDVGVVEHRVGADPSASFHGQWSPSVGTATTFQAVRRILASSITWS